MRSSPYIAGAKGIGKMDRLEQFLAGLTDGERDEIADNFSLENEDADINQLKDWLGA